MSSSRSTLFYRRQRETNTRKYACTMCDQRFYNKSQLTSHILKHTGEKPYHCPHCSYKAKQKFLVDKHALKIHNIPLPSTRTSRYRMRTSEPPVFGTRQIIKKTDKKAKKSGELATRLATYAAAENILDLCIPKKYLQRDKARGFIVDYWVIYPLSNPRQTKKTGKARKNSEKIKNFMNQIATLRKKFPATILEEMTHLREDNKKQQDNINIALELMD